MTTPNIDKFLPYAVTVQTDGTQYLKVPTHRMKRSDFQLNLPPGPCRVMGSFSGAEPVELRLYGMNGQSGAYYFKRVLEVIPAGTGSRSTSVHVVGALPSDWIQFQSPTGSSLATGYTGTIEVIPMYSD